MRDWNVLVTVNGHAWNASLRILRAFGRMAETGFYNVVVMHVDDPRAFVDALAARAAEDPAVLDCLARVVPVERTFEFATAEEFEARALEATAPFAPTLAGKAFYARVHRRGLKGRFSGHAEARKVAEALLDAATPASETPTRISFDAPDYVVAIETVGTQAGVALLSADDLARHPFLWPDAAGRAKGSGGEPGPTPGTAP